MIDYETFSKIHDCHDRQGLTIAQTARALGLDPRTVATWVARSRFEPRRSRPRSSVLDPPPEGPGLDWPEHGGTLDRLGLEAAGH